MFPSKFEEITEEHLTFAREFLTSPAFQEKF